MTEATLPDSPVAEQKKRSRLVIAIAGVLAILALVIGAGAVWLDSQAGHAFLIRQVAALEMDNGLRIGVEKIEGSIYSETKVHGLTLSDPKGRFLSVDKAEIEWRPVNWIFNELTIDDAIIDRAELIRLPELIDSGEDKPLLPQFDIAIERLVIKQLVLAKGIAGNRRIVTARGNADIRAGRAMIDLNARTKSSGDRIMLSVNAEPYRNKLDLMADIKAPLGGLIDSFLGLGRNSRILVDGEGDWAKWDGAAQLSMDEEAVALLGIAARDGLFGVSGKVEPELLPAGFLRDAAGRELRLRGNGRYEDQLANIDLQIASRAARIQMAGGFQTQRNAFEAMRVNLDILDPQGLTGLPSRNLQARALLNGPIDALRYRYQISADRIGIGSTILNGVALDGRGRGEDGRYEMPVELAIAGLNGNGDLVTRIASGLKARGSVRFEDGILSSDGIQFASQEVRGILDVAADTSDGRYAVTVSATAPQLVIDDVGVINAQVDLALTPGARGIQLAGDTVVRMLHVDNGTITTVTGGLPVITSSLLFSGGQFRLPEFQVRAPKVNLGGSGAFPGDNRFSLIGNGRHGDYGRFDFDIDGSFDGPRIALTLDDPLPAAGLSNVRLLLNPIRNGFSIEVTGGSMLGPFNGDGALLSSKGQTLFRVDQLKVSETIATGMLRPVKNGIMGDLTLTGGGIDGRIFFEPRAAQQLAFVKLTANNARFDGTPPITIRQANIDADIVLDDTPTITAKVAGQGIARGDFMIGRVAATATLRGGNGDAEISLRGARGTGFAFDANAKFTPDRYQINGEGRYARRNLSLAQPLVITRDKGNWVLSPTTLRYGDGQLKLSGRLGNRAQSIRMAFEKMPLELLDIYNSDLGFNGTANGTVNFEQQGNAAPNATGKLRVNKLTRSGLFLTSTPIDLGLNFSMRDSRVAARGVLQSKGKTVGRFQGRVTGVSGANWADDLYTRPLFAQARFNGDAASLWRLTGIETFDLTGPVQVAADIGGNLNNPEIEGRFVSRDARLQSSLTGTVISNIRARGTFDGSKLVIPRLVGATRGGGSINGKASFDFTVDRKVVVGIDIKAQATNAELVARDDFRATVTGPISITNGPEGGLIKGDVDIVRGYFKLGNATAAVALPKIATREINLPLDIALPDAGPAKPWRFDITAEADNQLMVEGLGLDSEWRANVALTGPVDSFRLTGRARMLRGNYSFAGREFRLEDGDIRFTGSDPINPVLDIAATASVDGLNAQIKVQGTGNNPRISFASTPALPEDELLSRILFGASITDISPLEALQLAAAVASLQGDGGLSPINQLRDAAGLDRLRILPSNSDSDQGTAIAAGKYLTNNVYVELISDGKGYSATRVEYQITRWLSILSAISTVGRQSVNIRASHDY